MTVAFADQEPDIEPVDTQSTVIDGQFTTAFVGETDILIELDNGVDASLSLERITDLRDVCDRALELHAAYFATH